MRIAACLIVKDSAETLERCLDSIRPFVDGVFIYDTGSTDGTFKLLERLAKIEKRKFPAGPGSEETIEVPLAPITLKKGEWTNDFSEARQHSFDMVDDSFEWLFWLDDDDVIEGGQWLRQLAATAHHSLDGFVMQYDYARDENGTCVCVLWRERLLRRSSGWKWQGPVHEVATRADGKGPNFIMVPPQQIRYVHERPPDRYPPTRNLEILQAQEAKAIEAGEDPDPRTLAYLGTELMSHERLAEAVPYLERYMQHPDAGWSDERMQVHHKLATCLRMLGNPMAALEVEHSAFKERKDWAETYAGMCESYVMLGRWADVRWSAGEVLRFGMPQSMLILNPLEFNFLPLIRMSEACVNEGAAVEALQWLERAAQVAPSHAYIAQQRINVERLAHENALVQSTMLLRETLVRHDENLKAYFLLENVPYLIAGRPEIVRARADQREMVKHYLEPDEYVRWYADEPKESTLTDDHIDIVSEAFGRVKGLLEGLAEQKEQLGRTPLVLDLGCNDWWMGEALARHGYRCDGVELNRVSYEKAIERRDRFEREATIVHGDLHDAGVLLLEATGEVQRSRNGDLVRVDPETGYESRIHGGRTVLKTEFPKYDAVSLFEVIEHVPDMEATLRVCESLLKPDGRVYISTPNGAFESGNLPMWHVVERKGHLRAIPMHELAEMLAERGEVDRLEQTDGDRVAFAAYTPKRKRGSIAFYLGKQWERWTPLSVLEGGLGGSETAAVRLSACLGRLGFNVKVYSETEPAISAGGVIWKPFDSFDPTEEHDLLVISRMPHVFDNPIGAKRAALWCHDHSYPGAFDDPERIARMTDVVCLSEWERDRFARLYPQIEEKLRVLRNGISYIDPGTNRTMFSRGGQGFDKRKPRCAFTSSADRGLDVMLKVWPRIREAVPEAELHVFYGFETLDRIAMLRPELLGYKAQILGLVDELGGEEAGVFLRGRIGQKDLARELSKARVLSYPTAFLETSCIGAMEARAAGLPIVTSELGGLKESVAEHGILLPWADDEDEPRNQSEEYQDAFVAEVCTLLTDRESWDYWHEAAREGVKELDWTHRALEWAALAEEAARPMLELVATA